LAATLIALAQTGHDLFPWGDHAIVEGETMRAWFGEQLLGTYSRYGWHHPGPALFYWMAPWHELFGRSPAALNAAVAFLNGAAVIAVVLVVRRWAGRTAALWAATLAGLYIAQQGPAFVRDFWIPHSVVFPFAALIALTAGASAGAIELVPLVALVASFLAETDLSVAPASAAVLVAGAIFFAATRGWRGLEPHRVLRVAAATVVISVVVWYPPLHEQLEPDKGNVTLLREFFQKPDPGHSLGDGVNAIANAVSVLVGGRRDALDAVPAGAGAKLFLGLTLWLLITGLIVGLRRERRFAAALCATALAGIVAEIYAVTQIRGELFTYLVDWSGAAAFAGWIGIGCALAPARWRVGALIPVAACAAGLAIWNVADQATHASLAKNDNAYSNPAQKPIDIAVRAWTTRHRVKRPTIFIPHNQPWPLAAGVYIDRIRHGRQVAIDPGWLGVFGQKFAPTGKEDAALIFTDAAQPKPPLQPGTARIAQAGGVIVYAGPPAK
jgi:hypothetical protein